MNALTQVAPQIGSEAVTFESGEAKLTGQFFRPVGAPRAVVVIHGATGVPQVFYRKFALWLAEQGFACLTYDYRDFASSLTGPMQVSEATMAKWGIWDANAAQIKAESLVPDAPLWVIGHSLGGMLLPFQTGAGRIDRAICVASGPTHISDHPLSYAFFAALFWWGPAAWLAPLARKYPASWFKIGPDLPLGVFRQWRRWCTRRGAFMRDIGRDLPVPDWRQVTARMKFVAISDDVMVPPKVVWRLMQLYPFAKKRQLTVRPEDFGLNEIGHVDVFRGRNSAVWPKLIE